MIQPSIFRGTFIESAPSCHDEEACSRVRHGRGAIKKWMQIIGVTQIKIYSGFNAALRLTLMTVSVFIIFGALKFFENP